MIRGVLRGVIEDSLVLWKVQGTIEAEGDGFLISAGSGIVVRIAPGRRSRWVVSDAGGGERECASVVGALSAIRERLEVSAGATLRFAPARRGA